MSRTARLMSAVLLAATLGSTLAGCGAGANVATPATPKQTAAKAARPELPSLDRTALKSTQDGISASSYYTVDRARRSASNALWRYQDLRDDWQRAWSDDEKDRIEQRMLSVLTRAGSDIRNMTSGSWDHDDRQINYIADRMLDEYEYLRRQWQSEWSIDRKREIINAMLVELTRGLKQVSDYRTYR